MFVISPCSHHRPQNWIWLWKNQKFQLWPLLLVNQCEYNYNNIFIGYFQYTFLISWFFLSLFKICKKIQIIWSLSLYIEIYPVEDCAFINIEYLLRSPPLWVLVLFEAWQFFDYLYTWHMHLALCSWSTGWLNFHVSVFQGHTIR